MSGVENLMTFSKLLVMDVSICLRYDGGTRSTYSHYGWRMVNPRLAGTPRLAS